MPSSRNIECHILKYLNEHGKDHCKELIRNAPNGFNYYSLKDHMYWRKHCVGNTNDLCMYSLKMLINRGHG